MSTDSLNPTPENQGHQKSLVDIALRIAFIGLIFSWCFLIFRPFITLVMWGMIIAISAYPFVLKMSGWMGGKLKWAVTVFSLVCIGAVLLPGISFTGSVVDTAKGLIDGLEDGTLTVPPPNSQVADWPLVGEKVFGLWTEAATSLESTLKDHKEDVQHAAGWLLNSIAGLGVAILMTILSILVAAMFMLNADICNKASIAFFGRMIGRNGEEFSNSSRDTIRSVVKGVVLVALIQGIFAWLGFVMVDVPAAGILAFIVLIFATIQLPAIIVMLPIIIYVFSYASTGVAIAFAIYSVLVAVSDAFLKPMLLGRGLNVPMLVILLGAIGGMILHGVIGLFIGAVVMALGYQLYLAWLNNWDFASTEVASEDSE